MKKIGIFSFIILLAFFITGCKKDFKYQDLDSITYENLLSIPETTYFVIGYQTNCSNCDKLKATIEKYYKYQKKHGDLPKIYSMNVLKDINKNIVINQGDSYPERMMNTTDYRKVKTKTTPVFMVIKSGELAEIISDYNTQTPVTDTKAYLNRLMN